MQSERLLFVLQRHKCESANQGMPELSQKFE